MTEIPGGLALVRLTVLTDGEQFFGSFGAPSLYRIQKATIDERSKTGDVTSTSSDALTPAGSARATHVAGETIVCVSDVEVTLVQASYDPILNLFSTPNFIRVGTYLRIEIFPDGPASSPWDILVSQVTNFRHEIDANGLQPITLTAISRGAWVRPGE